jgi:hypothetical protein
MSKIIAYAVRTAATALVGGYCWRFATGETPVVPVRRQNGGFSRKAAVSCFNFSQLATGF